MKRFVVTLIPTIGSVLLACACHQPSYASAPTLIPGTGLRLVGRHGPLLIYLDLTSTNKVPDYAIFQGNELLIQRETDNSNHIVTSHCEQGLNVLSTVRDKDGRILRRKVSYHDGSGGLAYSYIDKRGKGIWDYFMDFSNKRYYLESNLCWVIIRPDNDVNNQSTK